MTLVQRRLWGLFATLALGGGALGVAVWQMRESERREGEEAARAKVLRVAAPQAVTGVELATPGGTLVLAREGTSTGESAWVVTAPVRTAADANAIDTLVGELVGLERKSVVGDKEPAAVADKKLFGLEPPRFRVTLTTASGEKETLLGGKKNSFSGALYVQREGAPEVMLVEGALEYQLDKDLFKARDKRLVAFANDDVAALTVRVDGKPAYAVAQENGRVRLTAPRELPADSVEVTGLFGALSGALATEFVAEAASAQELRRYGLAEPKVAATLQLRTGAPRTLLFSEVGTAGDRRYYAGTGPGGPVIALSSGWAVEKLAVDAASLRDEHVLAFAREEVTALEIRAGETTLGFSRTVTDGADDWRITAPEQAKAQDAVLTGMLYRLWNLQANRIVTEHATAKDLARFGLAEPALRVKLDGEDRTLGTILFGKTEGDVQYAMAEGGTRVDTVDASVAQGLATDLAAYREDATAKK